MVTLFDGKVCEKCGGKEQIIDWNNNMASPCECKQIRTIERRIISAKLDGIFKRSRLDMFQTPEDWQKSVKHAIEDYTEYGGSSWLYVSGQTGCGKTHLCTAAFAAVCARVKSAQYMIWTQEAKDIISKSTDPERNALVNKYVEPQLLYIDDFFKGTTAPSAAMKSLAFDIINARYNRSDTITIFSSEIPLDDIETFDEAISGRIYERCGSGEYIVNIEKRNGRNWRYRNRNRKSI